MNIKWHLENSSLNFECARESQDTTQNACSDLVSQEVNLINALELFFSKFKIIANQASKYVIMENQVFPTPLPPILSLRKEINLCSFGVPQNAKSGFLSADSPKYIGTVKFLSLNFLLRVTFSAPGKRLKLRTDWADVIK